MALRAEALDESRALRSPDREGGDTAHTTCAKHDFQRSNHGPARAAKSDESQDRIEATGEPCEAESALD
jgi:hypothetical protein